MVKPALGGHDVGMVARQSCFYRERRIQMLRLATFRVFALILSLGMATPGFTQTGQWVDLGSARVNGQVDHGTIQCRNQGTFRAIQIRVRGSAVHFIGIVVRYGNGQREQINVRSVIQAGSSSRTIELPGARRVIDKIDLLYEKASWGAPPVVTIAGLR
jgi:hypothetical protein